MNDTCKFIPPSHSLIALGNLNAKKQDRRLERSDILPVQVATSDGWIPIKGFSGYGDMGVSSMAFPERATDRVFFATSNELFCAHLTQGRVEQIAIDGLKDIHELSVFEDDLWVANTGNDEVIRVSISSLREVDRIFLKSNEKEPSRAGDNFVDRFHCNQVFFTENKQPVCLVHHVSGKQFFHKVAEKVLKTHGNGGVIPLTPGASSIFLNLKAPHSIRRVADRYWIFDSGARFIRVYSLDWEQIHSIPTRGWGRGAAVTADNTYFFAGISSTRSRYLSPGSEHVPNLVEVFSCVAMSKKAEVEIPNIEQVSNLYLVPTQVVKQLHSLFE